MKIILSQEIPNLGKTGEVKNVRDGYARNYLLPRGLALPATGSNLKNIDRLKAAIAARQTKEESGYRALAAELSKAELRFELKISEKGRAFGSITAEDIARRLRESGLSVERAWIDLAAGIKAAGEHLVTVLLPQHISTEVRVIVESAK